MPRPKPLTHLAPPSYPSLAEHRRSGRRGFLRQLAVSGLAATFGGQLLAACDAADGGAHEGSFSEDPEPRQPRLTTPRTPPPEETPETPPERQPREPYPYEEDPWGGGARETEYEHAVRLPAEGWAWATAMVDDGYGGEGWDVAFAVLLSTYDADLAAYLQANAEDGLEAVRQLVLDSSCGELESQPEWLPAAVGDALVKRYTEDTGSTPQGFTSVELLIDTCSEWFAAGGIPDPGY